MLAVLLPTVLLACGSSSPVTTAADATSSAPLPVQARYLDADGDGFGRLAADGDGLGVPVVALGGDCDDDDASVFPGAIDSCNGIDDDCDGLRDPTCPLCGDGVAAVVDETPSPTIEEAVGEAVAGSIVHVCPGQWTVRATISRSMSLLAYADHPSQTQLLGDGNHRLLQGPADGILELAGLSLLGGVSTSGGAVYTEGDLVIRACRLEANRASDKGGALYVGGRLWFEDSVATDNRAHTGGGVWARAAHITDGELVANVAEHRGGGLAVVEELDLRRTAFEENLAAVGGGLVIAGSDAARISIEDSAFLDDRATWQGGSAALLDLADATVEFSNTSFWRGTAGYEGGCLYLEVDDQASMLVSDVQFTRCSADNPGGAVKIDGAGNWFTAGFIGSEFLDNAAVMGSGLATGSRLAAGEVWLHDSRLAGGDGTAVRLTRGIQLDSVATDFSSDPDDNIPMDLRTASEEHRVGGRATFWCDSTGHCASLTP